MTTSSDARNPVEALAEEFLDRKRRGEQPTLREYVDRYPELADDIRDLFPALLMVEDLGESSGGTTGSLAANGVAVETRLERLGDYRILREVGRGGMGVVYEAEQESLGRRVALKVLSAGSLLDPKQVRRFEREAKAAARLHHTNIVPVFGVGHQDGHHYFVMQFIAGLGLDVVLDDLRRLRGGKADAKPAPASSRISGVTAEEVAHSLLSGRFDANRPPGDGTVTEPLNEDGESCPPAQSGSSSVILPGSSALSASSDPDRQFYRSVARIGVQVAEALEYANRQGILHRDVKPSNLLLDNHGNVWVADFGLAKTSDADDLTHTGDILGTIRYMAPERFSGHCDARSDAYSLGLTLYELVALRPAFEASDRHRLMERVLHEEPERLKKLAPGVPRDLETIIAKATARDPAGRYATAAALAEDLQRFVEDRPIRARRVSASERAWRLCKRNPWPAGLAVALLVALISGTILSSILAARANREAKIAETEATRAGTLARDLQGSLSRSNVLASKLKASLDVSERSRLALTRERAQSNFERGRSACERGEISPGLLYFVESWRSAVDAQDSALAHAARASLSAWRHQAPRLLRQLPSTEKGRTSIAAFRPDGNAIAIAGADNLVRLWNPATGAATGLPMAHQVEVHAMAFSPDSKHLLTVAADRTSRIWDAATGSPFGLPITLELFVYSVAYSPDGKTVLGGCYNQTPPMPARLWDPLSGGSKGSLAAHHLAVVSVAYSPDGKTALTGSLDNTARLWDIATGKTICAPLAHDGIVNSVAFSPDGTTVLTGSDDRTARFWDAATGNPIGSPLVHQGAVRRVAYSPDGKTVLTGSADQTARRWDAVTGKPVSVTSPLQGAADALAFSPDGNSILTVADDGAPRIWEAAAGGRPLGRPLSHRASVKCMAFRPDSQAVITGCSDGSARIWDIATGNPIGAVLTHQLGVTAVAFSPDGKIALTGSSDGTARIWDAATGKPVGDPLYHPGPVYAVAYSPDGEAVLTGSSDPTARLWNVATGALIREILTLGAHVHAVAFGPDSKTLATAGEGPTAQLWNSATGAAIGSQMRPKGFVQTMDFSRDGTTLLIVTDAGIEAWDIVTGRLRGAPLNQVKSLATACFSPDGKRILVAAGDASARLWDATTARQLGPAFPHQGRVTSMAMSPDGRTAVTSSGNNEALLWDVAELPDDLVRIEFWVHLTTGLTSDDEGQIRSLDWQAWREQSERLSSLGGTPEEAKSQWRLDPILFGPEPTARAHEWVKRKHWAHAEAAFNEVVSARPIDPAVRFERARYFASRSQPARADEDYVQSYVLGSRDPKLIELIIGSETLFQRVVSELSGLDANLWARRGDLRLSQSRWDDAAADFARELELSPVRRAWGSPRSTRLLSLARWDRAYSRLMQLRPDDGQLWCVRGRYHALRGHWQQAAADLARGALSASPNSEEWFEHACLRLIVGDNEGYREFAQEIRRREGETKDPFVAYVLARTCAISAVPAVDPKQVIRWAELALRFTRPTWYLHALGAAHYRAGHFDEAIKWLEESKAEFSKARSGDNYSLQNNLVLAMAHERSGHTVQARALLEEAKRSLNMLEAAKVDGAISMPTVDWLPVQILRREAESVILYDPIFPANPFAK